MVEVRVRIKVKSRVMADEVYLLLFADFYLVLWKCSTLAAV
jgi:hypothetical protein